jgi:hypothetical protein
LCLAGTPSIKNRETVFPGHPKRIINPAFLQETVAFIFSACTRAEKLTPHLNFLRDLRELLFKLFS